MMRKISMTISKIEKLHLDASKIADENAATVIDNAFRTQGKLCPNCHYPENSEYYDNALYWYTLRKKELHKTRNMFKRVYTRPEAHNKLMRTEHELMVETEKWKHMKDFFRPCLDCQKKYNPHGKRKYGETVSPDNTFSERNFLNYE